MSALNSYRRPQPLKITLYTFRSIPLHIYGIISYLPARTPTEDELNEPELQLELTPDVVDWDPHSDSYQQQEEAMLNFHGELKEQPKRRFIVSSAIS